MSSVGPNSPGTVIDDSSVGTVAWSNPDNAKVSDDVYATATGSGYSHYLKASNFSFSVPTGATIDGILVEIEEKGRLNSIWSDSVFIIKSSGALGSTDKRTITYWPTTDTYVSYGSSSDLWGETWTSTDINSSNFGVALGVYDQSSIGVASVDHIRITVYYTAASTQGTISNVVSIGNISSIIL